MRPKGDIDAHQMEGVKVARVAAKVVDANVSAETLEDLPQQHPKTRGGKGQATKAEALLAKPHTRQAIPPSEPSRQLRDTRTRPWSVVLDEEALAKRGVWEVVE